MRPQAPWAGRDNDRPHDAIDPDFVDAVSKRQGIFDAAGGDREIALKIFARFELISATRRAGAGCPHEIEPPHPERQGLTHVAKHDLELRKTVEHSTQHQADCLCTSFHAVAPCGAFQPVVAKRRRHAVGRGSRVNIQRRVERFNAFQDRPVARLSRYSLLYGVDDEAVESQRLDRPLHFQNRTSRVLGGEAR